MVVPKPAKHALLEAFTRTQMLVQRGHGVTCPLCESTFRRFTVFGDPPRPFARCPRCRALERHRLAWLFLQRHTDLFSRNLRVLHVAPEPPLMNRLRTVAGLDYLTADIDSSRGDVQMDIMNIQYPDSSFDVVLCSHVLEHVSEAGTAMRELHRVLAAGALPL
jgi:SAM-dependent methyltransferase